MRWRTPAPISFPANDMRQKATPKKWGPKWAAAFLEALAITGVVCRAAELAKIDRDKAYRFRQVDHDFAVAWEAALQASADLLVSEARRRAYYGVDEPITHQGKLAWQWVDKHGQPTTEETPGGKLIPLVVKKYSDPLLMFLIKERRPEYREHYKHEHSGGIVVSKKAEEMTDDELAAVIASKEATDVGDG